MSLGLGALKSLIQKKMLQRTWHWNSPTLSAAWPIWSDLSVPFQGPKKQAKLSLDRLGTIPSLSFTWKNIATVGGAVFPWSSDSSPFSLKQRNASEKQAGPEARKSYDCSRRRDEQVLRCWPSGGFRGSTALKAHLACKCRRRNCSGRVSEACRV